MITHSPNHNCARPSRKLTTEVFLFTDMQRLGSLKETSLSKSPFLSMKKGPSLKDQHIIEEYEKLLNYKRNEHKSKLNQLAGLSRGLLSVSITISRILFQFGNDLIDDHSEQQSLTKSLRLIFGKLEKCLTFLGSDKANRVAERLACVEDDLNDSIIIEKEDMQPPEWLRIKISKYRSQETFEG